MPASRLFDKPFLTSVAITYEPMGPMKQRAFGYDELHRLTAANSPGLGNHTYTYTPTRNVKTIAGFGVIGGETIFRNGFQIEQPPTTTFTYDPFDRLTGVTAPNLAASYEIAPDGTRFKKTINGNITDFTYGPGGMLLTEHRRNPAQWTNHLWLDGKPVALVRNNALYWVQTDHLGRPEGITDQNKQRVWRATLKAFDRTVIDDEIGGFHLGFPGQYHDAETGFVHNIHRTFDPATGRYLESDPIGLAGGINTYAYVGGNPVNAVDPLGLCPIGITINSNGMDWNGGDAWTRAEAARVAAEAMEEGAAEAASESVCRNETNFGNWILGGLGLGGNVGAGYGAQYGTAFALAEHGSWAVRIGGLSEGVLAGGAAGAAGGMALGAVIGAGAYGVFQIVPICGQ
jgi:RHS repeat-associated protein